MAGITILACAVAIAFVHLALGLWRLLAVGDAGLGFAAFGLFLDSQAHLLAQEGLIGGVMSLILLVTGIACPRLFE